MSTVILEIFYWVYWEHRASRITTELRIIQMTSQVRFEKLYWIYRIYRIYIEFTGYTGYTGYTGPTSTNMVLLNMD